MKYVHESKVIPDDLSWEESCNFLQKYLLENPHVHYYAAAKENFDLAFAGFTANKKGCTTVLFDNLS
jgi:hypothetical protein